MSPSVQHILRHFAIVKAVRDLEAFYFGPLMCAFLYFDFSLRTLRH